MIIATPDDDAVRAYASGVPLSDARDAGRLVPPPDPVVEPLGIVVTMDTGERLHLLDWGGPAGPLPPLLLVHGLGGNAWTWTPVARRLCALTRVLAIDLRGHGLSESPRDGYDADSQAYDLLTVMAAHGIGPDVGGPAAVLAGHGWGAQVVAWTARVQPAGVAGLALVDGGWEVLEEALRMDAAEFARGLGEPPEVMASMDAYLGDRRDWDPASWDADQEQAARAAVDEKYAGQVVPVVRPHAQAATVAAMFAYRPEAALMDAAMPLLVMVAEPGGADDESLRERRLALDELIAARADRGHPPARIVRFAGVAHNLMRYRPDEVSAELLELLVVAGEDAA